jgi:hypothetical protein
MAIHTLKHLGVGRLLLTDCCGRDARLLLSKRPKRAILATNHSESGDVG